MLKVLVQPILVLEQDGALAEIVEDPIQIAGSEWPGYLKRFESELAAAQAKLNSE